MIMNYITKIKANITIYASKKTANILDGSYKSVYKGRSMDFDDLREYTLGDDFKDIDWKSSARSGNVLIRRYIAEKKHNILFILDTGKKMNADTESLESKKDVALLTTGIIAYLANKNGDFTGALYGSKSNSVSYHPFKNGLYNIEKILSKYDKEVENSSASSLDAILKYVVKYIKRKLIIFIITDLEGMESVEEASIKQASIMHDVMFVNIGDAYMTGENAYDTDTSFYIPELILKDEKLFELEKQAKEEVYLSCMEKFKKYKISTTTINSVKEIVTKIIELLERHKYAKSH